MSVIIEPFKIKVVEPLRMTSRQERADILKEAGYNLFLVHAEDVLIDLLTDSGTGALSSAQWEGLMRGDESYACSRSFYKFESVVKELTGLKHIIPTHQGRAAERILFKVVGRQGAIVPNNTHFDTTRANVEFVGCQALDFSIPEADQPQLDYPFKGNMNIEALEACIKENGRDKIPLVMMTVTNNTRGGQPVSLQNIRDTSQLCRRYKIPFFIDACRFAENAYFIQQRESGQKARSVKEIAQEMFRLCDGATMSGKKDGMVNIGGFLSLNDDHWAEECRNFLILTEGFPTYGGLAARDLEAFAVGLQESLHEDYLKYRIRSVQYLGEKLTKAGIPILLPTGGHAVYIDGAKFAEHIPREQFPGQGVACELYLEGGIRASEIGSAMFGKPNKPHKGLELVRLALPRRTYTQSHVDYVAEMCIEAYKNRKSIRGLRMTYQAPALRHFTARYEEIP